MIDYVFRYDPDRPGVKPAPTSAEEARQALIEGNRVFSQWMATCRGGGGGGGGATPQGDAQYVVACAGLEAVCVRPGEDYPTQTPFAVVLGCSDARVPTEMLFGQGFNDLFVVRVAGNVIGDAVQGTIDFSVVALSQSVRVLVSLGHTNCGAVKGAVEAYLDPRKFWSRTHTPSLRLIFQKIFVAVRESDNALRAVWGKDAPQQPGYRAALMDLAVCLNAAQTAFALRQQVEAAGNWDVDVLFGAYDVRTHQVCMPLHPREAFAPDHVNLAPAPGHPRDFAALALELAASYRRPEPEPESARPPSSDRGADR
jgi:carbonic anhydrase